MPERLEHAGGGPEPRVERLVDAMFFENVGRNERQVVNGLSEFRGHASRSNGHEANSDDGGRNLPRVIGRKRMGSNGGVFPALRSCSCRITSDCLQHPRA